jgi:hypothetical protein
MTRFSLAAPLALALLAGCATQATSAALASAEAVAADLVALEQQVQASGATVTPAELAALTNAVAAAQSGVTALTANRAQASSVAASIEAALQQVEPFLPEIAAVIGALAAPAPSAAPAPVLPAVAKLQADLAALRAAS